MSRIGKQQILIPEKTDVTVADGVVTVKGPLGTLSRTLHKDISVVVEGGEVKVKPLRDSKLATDLWGTFASHVVNMIAGVNTPYEKKLILEGVGYKVDVMGNKVVMRLGFSHPTEMVIPEGLTVTAEKNNISISGIDKEKVGSFAATMRAKKKPEPYKGKGIRYAGEIIRRKQGKKSV